MKASSYLMAPAASGLPTFLRCCLETSCGSSLSSSFLQIAFSDDFVTAQSIKSCICPFQKLSEILERISLLLVILFNIFSGIHLVPQRSAGMKSRCLWSYFPYSWCCLGTCCPSLPKKTLAALQMENLVLAATQHLGNTVSDAGIRLGWSR